MTSPGDLKCAENKEFERVYTKGFTVVDLKNKLPDDLTRWLDVTLVRYGKMSASKTGIPDFRPISDRKFAFRLDDSDRYGYPHEIPNKGLLCCSKNVGTCSKNVGKFHPKTFADSASQTKNPKKHQKTRLF